LSRFISGRLASSYERERDGRSNTAISWGHSERFGLNRTLTADVNYVTSTRLQRQNTFNPAAAIATIGSRLNYSDKLGPASLSVGATRTQFTGRKTVDQTAPSFSLSSVPLGIGAWLAWTPSFRYEEHDKLHLDDAGRFATRAVADASGQVIRFDSLDRKQVDRTLSFDTPLRVFG